MKGTFFNETVFSKVCLERSCLPSASVHQPPPPPAPCPSPALERLGFSKVHTGGKGGQNLLWLQRPGVLPCSPRGRSGWRS